METKFNQDALRDRIVFPEVYSWQSQASQYLNVAPNKTGVEYFKGDMGGGKFVDCLLYKAKDGYLLGILNHYPFDFLPYERKGNVNIWVNPDFKCCGIGTELLNEAMKRWDINFHQQRFTPEGYAFVTKFLRSKNLLK